MNTLENIKTEILNCKKCSLYKERLKTVFGEGNPKAKIVLTGEAPGASEDKRGLPFCGAAGKILDELLESAGIKRKEVYITNILKCHPPGNRGPRKKEIKACTPYLDRQIEVIKPKTICTLGNYSTKYIFEKYGLKNEIQGISKIHGKVYPVKFKKVYALPSGIEQFKGVKIIPLYHPAAALHNPNLKELLKKDFLTLKEL